MEHKEHYAAIDLGANSFHLVVMRADPHDISAVECQREIVRLGSGLLPDRSGLTKDARNRALRCLESFKEYLSQHQLAGARAVGTSIFRALDDGDAFLHEAEQTLGLPIEVLSGEDEARLIYRGAVFRMPPEKRLIIDIGGGSTEIVLGTGNDIECSVSLELGSAVLTQNHFKANHIDQAMVMSAQNEIDQQLKQMLPLFQGREWNQVLGASGSVKAVQWVLNSLKGNKNTMSLEDIRSILPLVWQAENIDQLSHLLNLNVRRTHVFPGGIVLLERILSFLEVDQLSISSRALREGMIAEIVNQQ